MMWNYSYMGHVYKITFKKVHLRIHDDAQNRNLASIRSHFTQNSKLVHVNIKETLDHLDSLQFANTWL